MRGEEKKSFDMKKFVVSAVIGGAAGTLAALLILMGAAALVLGGVLGDGGGAVYAAAAVGALIGGIIAEKRSRAGALPCAGAVTVVMLSLLICVGLALYEDFELTAGMAKTAAALAAGSIAGGLIGSGGKTKRVKKNRSRESERR